MGGGGVGGGNFAGDGSRFSSKGLPRLESAIFFGVDREFDNVTDGDKQQLEAEQRCSIHASFKCLLARRVPS